MMVCSSFTVAELQQLSLIAKRVTNNAFMNGLEISPQNIIIIALRCPAPTTRALIMYSDVAR